MRPLSWLACRGIGAAGERVGLDLPEMGAEREFQVLAVEPCLAIHGEWWRMEQFIRKYLEKGGTNARTVSKCG